MHQIKVPRVGRKHPAPHTYYYCTRSYVNLNKMIKIQGDFVLFFMQNCCIDFNKFCNNNRQLSSRSCLHCLFHGFSFAISLKGERRQIQSRNVKLNISYQFHLLGFTGNLSQRFDLCVKGAHQLIINHS